MNLKNYTSTVPVEKSITLIEKKLVSIGATHIAKIYEGEPRQLKGITFQITINNIPRLFKLPSKAETVFTVMWSEIKKPHQSTRKNIEEQSLRTAWKLLSDWVDIQASMILLEQAELAEVFLPYMYDGKTNQTLFEIIKKDNYKLLTQ